MAYPSGYLTVDKGDREVISFQDKFNAVVKLRWWMSDRDTIETIDRLMRKSFGGTQLGLLTEHQAHWVENLWEDYFGEDATERL